MGLLIYMDTTIRIKIAWVLVILPVRTPTLYLLYLKNLASMEKMESWVYHLSIQIILI